MRSRNIFRMSALAAVLASLGMAVGAPAQAASAVTTRWSHDDTRFARNAIEAGLEEIATAKLAQDKAQDPEVKAFAERMIQDHSQANERLQMLAAQDDVNLPERLDAAGVKDIDQLSHLSGVPFEREYMDKQVAGHRQVISQFRQEAASGHAADLRDFAQSTLPTLEQHLSLAESAQASVDPGTLNASAEVARTAMAPERGSAMGMQSSTGSMARGNTGM